MTDELANWRRRLAGDWLPVDPYSPELGCYRMRRGDNWIPVRIFEHVSAETGEIRVLASVAGQVCAPEVAWPRCASSPVTAASYRYYSEHKSWPDDTAPPGKAEEAQEGSNFAALPLDEQLAEQIGDLERISIAWFEGIGSDVKTQPEADQAANYAERFLELEGAVARALKTETTEPLPILAAARTRWKPLETRAAEGKNSIKQNWLKPYLSRKAAERTAAHIDRLHDPQTIGAGAGIGKRASLTTRRVAVIVDPRAFGRYLLDWGEIPAELIAVLQKIAQRLVVAHVRDVPGIDEKEEVNVR